MEETTSLIPKELYRAILKSGVSKNDLCSVARASRFMQSEAERLLYHDVRGLSSKQAVIICQRLLSNHRLLRHVCTITFRVDEKVLPSFYRLVASVLQRVEELRHLDIALNTSNRTAMDYCALVLQQCPFKLLSLRCDFRSNEVMLNFLASQPTILDFDLPGNGPAMHIPDHILPNLAILRSGAEKCRIKMDRKLDSSFTHLRTRSLLKPVGFSLKSAKAIGASFITTSLPKLAPALEILSVFNLTRFGVSYRVLSTTVSAILIAKFSFSGFRNWRS
jgi:hypothetical protein